MSGQGVENTFNDAYRGDVSEGTRSLRSPGMRDRDSLYMAHFREIERIFLEISSQSGFREIRTPTLEPLHLYTTAETLTPKALEEAYSFVDWDGWSGERVVMRPDATISAARWYVENIESKASPPVNCISYVQPAYRFTPTGDREIWQCGLECFGESGSVTDVSMIKLAIDFLQNLGLSNLVVSLADSSLLRLILGSSEFSYEQSLKIYDRLIELDVSVLDEALTLSSTARQALELLMNIPGDSVEFTRNIRTTIGSLLPATTQSLDNMITITEELAELTIPFVIRPAITRSFEYYTGVTFSISGVSEGNHHSYILGGRYDSLIESLGGKDATAVGWAANMDALTALSINSAN